MKHKDSTMRIILALFTTIAIMLAAEPASAEPSAADRATFKRMIRTQIDAFIADDAATAFRFADPRLRLKIHDPEAFLYMVRTRYTALYRPRAIFFGGVGDELGSPTQRVTVIGPHKRVWRAFYGFERHDGAWRIAGVVLKRVAAVDANGVADTPDHLIVTLAPNNSDQKFIVVHDKATDALNVAQLAGAKPQDKDFELWLIKGKAAPVSLGVANVAEGNVPKVPAKLKAIFKPGAKLAISIEPKGGSPTGAPTGPVVALGEIRTTASN